MHVVSITIVSVESRWLSSNCRRGSRSRTRIPTSTQDIDKFYACHTDVSVVHSQPNYHVKFQDFCLALAAGPRASRKR